MAKLAPIKKNRNGARIEEGSKGTYAHTYLPSRCFKSMKAVKAKRKAQNKARSVQRRRSS